jgi:pimeloyl-ACP methyl ester carboxylesterase
MAIVPLHHIEHGDRGARTAVVLLHAFPLSHRMWTSMAEFLDPGVRLVTPDFRGFGASPLGADPPSLGRSADDVAALLDRLELDRVTLGGLSMGGYVTMEFLRRHADRVDALILADTRASADSPAGRANRERIAAAVGHDPSIVLSDVVPPLTGPTTRRERLWAQAEVESMAAAAPPATVAWAELAMAARPDSFDVLADLSAPTLVVVGDEDEITGVSDARAMADVLPHATLQVLPRVGHLSALEDPPAFADALNQFLA